jgi:hypothetical protein
MIQGDRICWAANTDASELLAQIINRAASLLGPVDPYTLQLRNFYARKLSNSSQRKAEAKAVYSSMLRDLRDVKPTNHDAHPFSELLQPRTWIQRLEKSLARLSDCEASSGEDQAGVDRKVTAVQQALGRLTFQESRRYVGARKHSHAFA